MNDTIEGCSMTGRILIDDKDINEKSLDPVLLRARVGMVFQKPNPFPKSIFENVAYGPKIHGLTQSSDELNELVEESLKKAGLFSEIKDRIHEPGTSLSGGHLTIDLGLGEDGIGQLEARLDLFAIVIN